MDNRLTFKEYFPLIPVLMLISIMTIGITFISIILIPFYRSKIAADFYDDIEEMYEGLLSFIEDLSL